MSRLALSWRPDAAGLNHPDVGRRRMLSAALAASVAQWALPACSTTHAKPMRRLTADDFRGAGLRGVGFGMLRFGNRSDTDHDSLLGLRANHVRVFIEVEREGAAESYRIDPAQLVALDAMLLSLERRGIYLVLAASFGEDARGDLFKSSKLQASAVEVWRQLARRVQGRAVVAGFDIVNEPVPPGLTYAARQDRWLDFAARVIEAVQAADGQRVLVIESAPDATPESFENLRPLPFGGLVYSLHSYRPMEFTHQTVMREYPQLRSYPEIGADGRTSSQVLASSLNAPAAFGRHHNLPIYVGEFSAPRWAPGDSTVRYVADSITLFHRHGWSWAYHEYRAWHGWDPEMSSSSRDATPRSVESPVVRALRAAMRAAPG